MSPKVDNGVEEQFKVQTLEIWISPYNPVSLELHDFTHYLLLFIESINPKNGSGQFKAHIWLTQSAKPGELQKDWQSLVRISPT